MFAKAGEVKMTEPLKTAEVKKRMAAWLLILNTPLKATLPPLI